jgi:hypothetical protein
MISYIKNYEAGKSKRHPVGMTVEWPDGDNNELFASPADWISPNGNGGYWENPPAADGSKVIINDTDHLSYPSGDEQWMWKSILRGLNPAFMDPYDCTGDPSPPGCDPNNPTWVSLRLNLGYALGYAERMNLVAMTPRGDLASSGYCLANPAASGAEYLVYLPPGATATAILDKLGSGRVATTYLPTDSRVTVDLSATPGELSVEWFNPSTGETIAGGTVVGGASRSFTAPFSGDAVLYLYQREPPVISSVAVHPLDTTAGFAWTTDRPATSQVQYGPSPTLGMSIPETSEYVTSHSVRISGLSPTTKYYYKVRSAEVGGLSAESEVASFTTLAAEDIEWLYLPVILKGP